MVACMKTHKAFSANNPLSDSAPSISGVSHHSITGANSAWHCHLRLNEKCAIGQQQLFNPYDKLLCGRPTTTQTSLHVNGYVIDKVNCKVPITNDKSTIDVVKTVI